MNIELTNKILLLLIAATMISCVKTEHEEFNDPFDAIMEDDGTLKENLSIRMKDGTVIHMKEGDNAFDSVFGDSE